MKSKYATIKKETCEAIWESMQAELSSDLGRSWLEESDRVVDIAMAEQPELAIFVLEQVRKGEACMHFAVGVLFVFAALNRTMQDFLLSEVLGHGPRN